MASSSIHFREAPVSGHVFRKAASQVVAGWQSGETQRGSTGSCSAGVWRKRERPPQGYLNEVAVALDQLSRRPAWTGGDDLVFANAAGEHIEDSARFYEALKAAGLKHLRFHDLRHSFGALAVQVFPLPDVKAYIATPTLRRP
jgi:hypothetical protein